MDQPQPEALINGAATAWPEKLCVEINGLGPELTMDSGAFLVHLCAMRTLAGTPVNITYVDFAADFERAKRLRIENSPTVRLLLAEAEIARTTEVFFGPSAFRTWLETMVAAH